MAIQPLKGLNTSITFPDGAFDNELEAVAPANQPAVFYCDAVFPTSPSNGGLFEKGGSGTGTWVGFRDSGAYFRVRGGNGGVSIAGGGSSTTTCAVLDIPAANLPLDNNYHAVVWAVNPSAGTVKLWIDGESYGTGSTSGGGQLQGGLWEGSGSGAWGTSTTTNIVGEPTTGWPASVGELLYAFGIQSVDTSQIDGLTQSVYGSDNYGSGYYSAIKFVEGSATATATASASAVGRRVQSSASVVANTATVTSSGLIVKSSSATVLAFSDSTSNANYTTNAASTVNGQVAVTTQGVRVQFVSSIVVPTSTVVTSCERVRPTSAQEIQAFSVLAPVGTIVTAGGSGVVESTSATTASAQIVKLGAVSDSATATTDSNGLIVRLGVASLEGNTTTTSTGERIQITSASVNSVANVLSSAAITAVGASEVDGNSETLASCVRIVFSSGAVASQSVTTSIGREKWEPIVIASKTWTPIAQNNETWNKLAA
jgi:hypothetical protein